MSSLLNKLLLELQHSLLLITYGKSRELPLDMALPQPQEPGCASTAVAIGALFRITNLSQDWSGNEHLECDLIMMELCSSNEPAALVKLIFITSGNFKRTRSLTMLYI